MTTALITHPDCLNHVTPEGHPEQVARLEYVLEALTPLDLLRTEAPLAIGTAVSLRFTPTLEDAGHKPVEDERFASVLAPNVDLTPIELQGTVAWNTLASNGGAEPGMGIAFGSLEPNTRARLEALVRSVAYLDM